MTTPTPEAFRPSAQAVRILTNVAMLCDQANREAAVARRADRSLRNLALGMDSLSLWADAVAMLPGGIYSPPGEVVAVGDDPIVLLRQAERLTAELGIEQFPPGMSQLIVYLIDTIRDLA